MSSTLAPSSDESLLQPLFLDLQATTSTESPRALSDVLQRRVEETVKRIPDPTIRETTGSVLEQVIRLLNWLRLVDRNLRKLDHLRENLSLLELVHLEARSLVEYLQVKSTVTNGPGVTLRDVLDGIAYSLTHDLRRVFETDLAGPIAEQSTPIVYGKIVHAQDC